MRVSLPKLVITCALRGYRNIGTFLLASFFQNNGFFSICSLHIQVTNDIFTKEDGEFLIKHGALPEERIRAVETGGCPHAAIREDISINLGPLEELSNLYKADLLLCESGGGIFYWIQTKLRSFLFVMDISVST